MTMVIAVLMRMESATWMVIMTVLGLVMLIAVAAAASAGVSACREARRRDAPAFALSSAPLGSELAVAWAPGHCATLPSPDAVAGHRRDARVSARGIAVSRPATLSHCVLGACVDTVAAAGSARFCIAPTAQRCCRAFARCRARPDRLIVPQIGCLCANLDGTNHGTHLITGGLGSLGLSAARLLCGRGSRSLLLLGRSGRGAPCARLLGGGQSPRGSVWRCQVSTHGSDVGLSSDGGRSCAVAVAVSGCCWRWPCRGPVCGRGFVGGFLHAGGVLRDRAACGQSVGCFRAVGAPKAGGLRLARWWLGGAHPLSWAVMYSSTSSLLVSAGLASYGAFNALLDARCASAQASGLPRVSVQWGAWSGGGMATETAALRSRLASAGIGMVEPSSGLAALECCIADVWCLSLGGMPLVTASPFDAARLSEIPSRLLPQAVAELGAAASPASASAFAAACRSSDAGGGGVARPSPRSGAVTPRRSVFAPLPLSSVASSVSRVVFEVLGRSDIGGGDALMDAGLDSMSSTQLQEGLGSSLGLSLPATLAFDYPTIDAIAVYAHACVALSSGPGDGTPFACCARRSGALLARSLCDCVPPNGGSCGRPCARLCHEIWVGAGCGAGRFEAAARDSCVVVPPSRWDCDALFSATSRFGAIMRDVSEVDLAAFRLSVPDGTQMDPQHRLLLGVSSRCLPLPMSSESTSARCGVAVGIGGFEYGPIYSRHGGARTSSSVTSFNLSVACGRLSFFHGLQGPSYSIDTACSSGLTSIHVGCAGIAAAECSSSLALSVNLNLGSSGVHARQAASMLASDGRCKTLDSRANGYVFGESCTCALLLAGGDGPGALVAGSSVNQDGRSSTLTAPNGPSQQRVIASAVLSAGAAGSAVRALQMHGTGTPLGDPIETSAAAAALCQAGGRATPLCLEAVKSAVGHAEWSAGAVGALQASMSLRSRSGAGAVSYTHLTLPTKA